MTKHTTEPWFGCCNSEKYTDRVPHFIFNEHTDKAICRILYNDPREENYNDLEEIITVEEAKANSRRIASCVNACIGMEDPEKEISELKKIKELYQNLQNSVKPL